MNASKTPSKKKTILVTSALPYANGPIHLGHIAGAYLPADVFARFHRLKKHGVVYICGTDEYGVAVSITAEKEGRSPKEQVDHFHEVILDIFKKFDISFDHFSRTTTTRHQALSQQFFTELHQNGHIEDKTDDQFYCSHCSRFLADRFVEGTCYACKAEHARGDECPACGEWIDPIRLLHPQCKLCGHPPEIRPTRHWFLKLGEFKQKLHDWIDKKSTWKSNVLKASKAQIDKLESRPISRDLSWGIPVPLPEAKGKVLYVWFDAPIGYIDATMEWAEKKGNPDQWKEYWQNPEARIVNFIGKDNIPFHLLVWPSMLMGQTTSYTLADNVPANEFYNLEGRPFSKSEGWTVELDSFFETYSSDQIRYAIAANAPETKDSDFNWRDFQKFNNADLANVFGNLVNRVMQFTHKNFSGKIPKATSLDAEMKACLKAVEEKKETIAHLYDTHQLRKAAYEIIDIARLGNRFFDEQKPWKTLKEDKTKTGCVLFTLFRLMESLAVCAWPLLPKTSESVFKQLGLSHSILDSGWDFSSALSEALSEKGEALLGEPKILFKKIEDKQIKIEIEKLQKTLKNTSVAQTSSTQTSSTQTLADEPLSFDPLKEVMTFDDFMKMDLRTGKILQAAPMKGSKKLMKLQVDLGFEKRQIIAGIAKHYSAEDLLGKSVVVVANLLPRAILGEMSEGMLLAGSLSGKLNLASVPEMNPGILLK